MLPMGSQGTGGGEPSITAWRLQREPPDGSWMKRADLWETAARAQAEALSTSAGSPGPGCLMLKDMKHMLTPGYFIDDVHEFSITDDVRELSISRLYHYKKHALAKPPPYVQSE